MRLSIANLFSNKEKGVVASIGLFLLMFASALFGEDANSRRSSFNDGWLFQKNDPVGAEGILTYEKIKNWITATGNEFVPEPTTKPGRPAGNLGEDIVYTAQNLDDRSWRVITLPHDWCIEGDFQQALNGESARLPCAGIGWYRKHFTLSQGDMGKQIYIDFDGAISHSAVWLNGKFVGGWPYGYASFRHDLTPFIEFGKENVLAVRLDNAPDSSRWYPGAGIYRNVWLVKTAQVHVGHWGTNITTPLVTKESANVVANIVVANDSAKEVKIGLKTTIYRSTNGSKSAMPVAEFPERSITISAHSAQADESTVSITGPDLWSPQTPNLYFAVTQIRQNGELIDSYDTLFGIRSIKFDADNGFFLNGEHLYIKGVCEHDDLGALGLAVNVRALERKFEILKEMGVNAIRTSHNPHTPEFLDLADQMGFLVLDEAFDAWTRPKRPNDYSTLFPDWHEKDLRAFIRRDRNHPSVILWSTGNEIPEQDVEGHAISAQLTKIVHEEDPTRPVTAAANLAESGYTGFQTTVDVFGYNYKPGEYAKFHKLNPKIPIFSTESSSTISSRGEYFFPVSKPRSGGLRDFQVSSDDLISSWLAKAFKLGPTNLQIRSFDPKSPNPTAPRGETAGAEVLARGLYFFPELEDVAKSYSNFQLSSYDLTRQDWATLAETEFAGQDRNSFVAGEFVWTGFDYLGETNPFDGIGPTRSTFTDAELAATVANDIKSTGKINVPQRSSYFGILDLCGFKKDRFYLYQSRWRPDLPMAHILPHWNWPERDGKITPVHIYTSGDEAELFLNGRSLGRKKRERFQYRLRWDDVIYEPGELRAIAYKNGEKWAEDLVKTTTAPTQVMMEVDRPDIAADGSDLSFITIKIADKNGSTVPRRKDRIKFEITGPGDIVGIDNGDATDLESFQSLNRRVFNGMALVMVRSKKNESGKITVKASANGLKPAVVDISTKIF